MLCCNIFDVLVMMAVMALGWAVPLEQAQLFKANFITHMFYPWCMVFQPSSFYNMMHPPRSRDKPLLPNLTRKVVIPLIFFAYFILMLSAQYAGAMIYVGTVDRDQQTGTSSINAFYSDKTDYVCLYASTMTLDEAVTDVAKKKSDGNPATIVYDRDAAPLHCRVRRLTFSGWKESSEYGRHDKDAPDTAVHGQHFQWFSGSWGGFFDLQNSFLQESFQGEVHNFQDKGWKDQKSWLEKCSERSIKGHNGQAVAGDSDKLCWKDCDGVPCWKKHLEAKDEDIQNSALLEKGSPTPKETQKAAKEVAILKAGGSSHSSNQQDEGDEPLLKPVLYKKYNAGAWGVRQMRSLILLTMVLIEFMMLYSFASHEFSLPQLGLNMAFPYAWVPMLIVLLSYIYLPVYLIDQGFAPLDGLGVFISLCLVAAFYMTFELTKVLHRSIFEDELLEKTAIAGLLAEGCLRAFPSREEAWMKCPHRKPLLSTEEQGGYGSCQDAKTNSFCPTNSLAVLASVPEEVSHGGTSADDAV